MASNVEICNRALQKLGAKRIVSLTEDSTNARACNVAFGPVKLAELRKHTWSCATKRASLAADTDEPLFTRDYAYTLPSDWVRLIDNDPEDNFATKDWQIEGKKIITNDSAPLEIRYIYEIDDPNEMDPLLREAISSKLALELCEELTQSNTKKADLREDYKEIMSEAKRANAVERVAGESPDSLWITARA